MRKDDARIGESHPKRLKHFELEDIYFRISQKETRASGAKKKGLELRNLHC